MRSDHVGIGQRSQRLWIVALVAFGLLVGLAVFLTASGSAAWSFVLRLYEDKAFLKATVEGWGWLGPVVFVVIQALQVVVSPIPGEVTGAAGGFLFGARPGFLYSTVGLTAGTLACFGIGRWLGARFVRALVADRHWQKIGFIVKAEGTILAFVVYLFPGFPKDIVSYIFGLSPIRFSAFAVVSTLGRMPGTWILSTQGGHISAGELREFALWLALVAAVVVPVYYYRDGIVRFLRSGRR